MTTFLGVDHGSRRIGLAIGDDETGIVTPLRALASLRDPRRDAATVLAEANEYDIDVFVVGLPLNMDDSEGGQAKICRTFAEQLKLAVKDRPVELFDERLTSFAADDLLNEFDDLTNAGRKARRDGLAAQVLLQRYMASRRPTSTEFDESDSPSSPDVQ